MDVISVKIMRTNSLTKGFAQFARDFHGRVGFTDCLVADRHPQFNHPVALVAKNTFINCVDFLESLEARSNRVLYKSGKMENNFASNKIKPAIVQFRVHNFIRDQRKSVRWL